MIIAIISFAAGEAFGIIVMCLCTVAGQTDKENNAK